MSQFRMSKAEMKAKATSIKAWEVPKSTSAFAPEGTWSNKDNWVSDLVHGSTWTAVASLFSLGLTWWEGLLAIFSGGIFICTVIAANGVIAAHTHTPFAVTCRASFGWHLSKFCVVSRMVIAWFWFSIQTYTGGTGITQMIIAIWPSYRNFPNHLPASSGVTSQEFLSFFLFWVIQFPFILVHPRKLRPIFLAKGIILPIVALGSPRSLRKGLPLKADSGRSQTGQWITLACNIGDFSRYSKRPSSAAAQVAIVPFLWVLTAAFGAIATCMLKETHGVVFTTVFQITDLWQGSHSGRFFAFVCSAAWVLGYIGLNITANSISASNDITTLFPRWGLPLGQMISVTVGVFGFAPWKVMASASSIVSFATSYSVVLAPIASILCFDYYWVKMKHIDVPALYDPRGRYYYKYGFNWRALVGLVVGVGPNIPGMGHALSSSFKIGGAEYIYASGVCWGVIVGGGTHVILSRIFPDHESLVPDSIYAHEVLAERGARALEGSPRAGTEDGESEKEKEAGATTYAKEV
ncbi:hypothetical protein RQP46_004284 [Phenoliferia psychrophenolica]